MAERVKIISARRAYEFRPDDLRLSVLSVAQVHQQIQQYFSFQVVQIGTPLQTFGPFPNTMPPGVVFDYGTTQTPNEVPTPIRFMHFEPLRIVIDVAGPSSAIDWTFQQLLSLLQEVRAPDGSPLIGEPERIREYSELTLRHDFGIKDLVSGPLLDLANEVFGEEGRSMVPLGVKFGAVTSQEEPNPGEIGNMNFSRGNMFEYRFGTRYEEGVFFSCAQASTDKHVYWLEALAQRVKL